MTKVEDWTQKADNLATRVEISYGNVSVEVEDELKTMAEEGEDFNFRLSEVSRLRQVRFSRREKERLSFQTQKLCEWHRRVIPILEWEDWTEKWRERIKLEEGEKSIESWDPVAVNEMIVEGKSLGASNTDLDRLASLLKIAADDEQEVRLLLVIIVLFRQRHSFHRPIRHWRNFLDWRRS